MAVKDWSTFDLTQDSGDTRFPPPEYECHRTPTLNANTVLKAISDHGSDRLEYLWLDTRQGRHQIPPPPVYECHRTPTLNANTVLKAISDHGSDRLEYIWLDTRQGRHQIPPPPGVRVSQDTHPQCQYRAKSHFRPWQWQIGVPLTWHKTGETPDSPPPPVYECHRTPTLNANTVLKAISDHGSDRLEYIWLDTRQGRHQIPPPRCTSVTGHPPSMPIPC